MTGLSTSEALSRLRHYGPNTLPEAKPPRVYSLFVHQFKSAFIYVLLVATAVSFALGQHLNGIFILLVLLLNASIGTVQEYAAQKAASGLKKMVPQRATVIRDGKSVVIDSAELVPGDIVNLMSGDKVPADIRLQKLQELVIDESMLTGESMAIEKSIATSSTDAMPAGDRLDMAYAGTIVHRGRGSGEVIATGQYTEIGKIAADVFSKEEASPPLIQRIEKFTLKITYGILILIALIFIITVLRGDDVATVFFLGVALAVSAIPEGLPVAITIALAIGMRRMANSGVIIRKLIAVESLGSCTYIASDKTGTLTVNEMTIREIVLANGAVFKVSGEGINPHGLISKTPDAESVSTDETAALQLLYDSGLLANEAELKLVNSDWIGQGDSVDIAFLVLAEKAGIDIEDARKQHSNVGNIPYESLKAYAASVNRYHGKIELFVKGSVEKLLAMNNESLNTNEIIHRADQLASEGYRVLGLAHRSLESIPSDPKTCMEELEFIGMVGIIDPLRPEVIAAVAQCRRAQIKVAMITGDHPKTAAVLAAELGITSVDNNNTVTGQELGDAFNTSPAAFNALVQHSRVFARVEPHQKMEIVESLIANGEFVAVTGDGINDAPALKHAHVGIAMGKRGSDVARENADIILTDDNFNSIVEGVKQGRIVYNNIRKVIFLLISTGAAEITLIMLSILFGLPLPLMPLQLLWLNLVTNGIQDVALVFEPEEGHELDHPPRRPNEPIFNRLMIERVLVNAVVMGLLAFAVFYWQIQQGVDETSARNITLLLMVLFENIHVFNSRSETLSIFKQYFFGNPFLLFGMLAAQSVHIIAMHLPGLSTVLMIAPVSLQLWGQLLLIAILLIVVDEIHKLLNHTRSKSGSKLG